LICLSCILFSSESDKSSEENPDASTAEDENAKAAAQGKKR
jgi:hypothetical protein